MNTSRELLRRAVARCNAAKRARASCRRIELEHIPMWMRVRHQGDVVFFAVDPSRLVVEPLADCERFRHEVEEQSDAFKVKETVRGTTQALQTRRQIHFSALLSCTPDLLATATAFQETCLGKVDLASAQNQSEHDSSLFSCCWVVGSGPMLETLAAGNVDSGFHSAALIRSLSFSCDERVAICSTNAHRRHLV